jgi:hypothetical protein
MSQDHDRLERGRLDHPSQLFGIQGIEIAL